MTKKHEVVGDLIYASPEHRLDPGERVESGRAFVKALKAQGYQIVPRKLPEPYTIVTIAIGSEENIAHISQATWSILLDQVLRSDSRGDPDDDSGMEGA